MKRDSLAVIERYFDSCLGSMNCETPQSQVPSTSISQDTLNVDAEGFFSPRDRVGKREWIERSAFPSLELILVQEDQVFDRACKVDRGRQRCVIAYPEFASRYRGIAVKAPLHRAHSRAGEAGRKRCPGYVTAPPRRCDLCRTGKSRSASSCSANFSKFPGLE